MILRIEVGTDGQTRAWLYRAGDTAEELCEQNMADVAAALDISLKKQWSQVEAIYVYLGPAGYSRLRATHSFALGVSLAHDIPVSGYTKWSDRLSRTAPRHSKTPLKPIYP